MHEYGNVSPANCIFKPLNDFACYVLGGKLNAWMMVTGDVKRSWLQKINASHFMYPDMKTLSLEKQMTQGVYFADALNFSDIFFTYLNKLMNHEENKDRYV